MSPVESWQAPRRALSNSAWVPLPTPGAPSKTSRRGLVRALGGGSHCAAAPRSHDLRSGLVSINGASSRDCRRAVESRGRQSEVRPGKPASSFGCHWAGYHTRIGVCCPSIDWAFPPLTCAPRLRGVANEHRPVPARVTVGMGSGRAKGRFGGGLTFQSGEPRLG